MKCLNADSLVQFNAFVGSYIQMSSSSYIAVILPNLLTRRKNIAEYGPFRLGRLGFVFNAIACAFMLAWFVIYCFPFTAYPTAASMNYASVLWGGFTAIVGAWWLLGARKGYTGPPVNVIYGERAVEGHSHDV